MESRGREGGFCNIPGWLPGLTRSFAEGKVSVELLSSMSLGLVFPFFPPRRLSLALAGLQMCVIPVGRPSSSTSGRSLSSKVSNELWEAGKHQQAPHPRKSQEPPIPGSIPLHPKPSWRVSSHPSPAAAAPGRQRHPLCQEGETQAPALRSQSLGSKIWEGFKGFSPRDAGTTQMFLQQRGGEKKLLGQNGGFMCTKRLRGC